MQSLMKFSEYLPNNLVATLGRAVLLRRFGIKAVQQHSPTRKRFMGTKRVKFSYGSYL